MKKRRLGANGPEVSAIGLGCMAMSEFYGESDEAAAKRIIIAALERGITMLDTADTYGLGHNEKLIADAQKEWSGRERYATSAYPNRRSRRYAGPTPFTPSPRCRPSTPLGPGMLNRSFSPRSGSWKSASSLTVL